MSSETAAVLLELCAIVEGWPSMPAKQQMDDLKLRLMITTGQAWKCPCNRYWFNFYPVCTDCGRSKGDV